MHCLKAKLLASNCQKIRLFLKRQKLVEILKSRLYNTKTIDNLMLENHKVRA